MKTHEKQPVCNVLLPNDVAGCVPVLRPGDVIRVAGEIGVVSISQVIVDGSCCDWYSVNAVRDHGNMPSYSVQWGSRNGLRNAWWEKSELEVVSLGPFHSFG
jgi:hypothetical protein